MALRRIEQDLPLWAVAGRERKRAGDAAYRKRHPERKRASEAAWRTANRGHRLAYWAAAYRANPTKWVMDSAVRRARAAGVLNTITPVQRLKVMADCGWGCVYCKKPGWASQTGVLHWDHMVPLVRGGGEVYGNLAPACQSCNLSKGSKTVCEFLYMRAKHGDHRAEAANWDELPTVKAKVVYQGIFWE